MVDCGVDSSANAVGGGGRKVGGIEFLVWCHLDSDYLQLREGEKLGRITGIVAHSVLDGVGIPAGSTANHLLILEWGVGEKWHGGEGKSEEAGVG